MSNKPKEEKYDYLIKLIIIGDSSVGKTNILSQYINKTFTNNSKSTVGVEFASKNVKIENKQVLAQIWDTAGQERYKSITSAYYKGAKGAFIVYDITNKSSFESIDKWVQALKEYGDKDIAILLIGNKADLEKDREVQTEEGQNKASSFDMGFTETSAKTGKNVDNIFETMLKEICYKFSLGNEENEGLNIIDNVQKIDIGNSQQNKKKNCC